MPVAGPDIIAAVRAASPARIQSLQLGQRRVWLKRHRPRSRVLETLQRLSSLPLQRSSKWMPMMESSAVALAREARRFVHLRERGFRVPEVIAATDEWILLEDVGPSVRWEFGRADVGVIAGQLFELLASLHAAGYWHGGAQARNFTCDAAGRYAMIDMEVGLPADTPLQTLQARDLFMLLQSLVEWVEPGRLHALLDEYVVRCGRGARDESAATVAWLRRGWWRLIPGGDARRARAAAAILNRAT